MKKIFTLSFALVASAAMISAQSLSDATTLWVKEVSNSVSASSHTTQGGSMALAADGDLLLVGQAGSTGADQDILFGDAQVAAGTPGYSGNSANQALVAMKISTDGDVRWALQQATGEISSNEDRIVATPDGGALIFTSMRHTDGNTDPIVITDGAGNDHNVDWDMVDGTRCYVAIVIKVDAQGAIEWTRLLEPRTDVDAAVYPKWSQSARVNTQGVKAYAIDVDNSGNIYVGGNMCADLTVDGVTIPCHNVSTWNGNAQSTVGNLFVIKLDAEGNYVSHLTTGGAAAQESVRQLKVVGNSVYMAAWVGGIAGSEFTLDGNSFTPASANQSWLIARLDTDLNVDWATFHESTVSGSAWQEPTLTVIGGNIYVSGTAKYGINVNGTAYANSAAKNAREPWLIRFDTTTGAATGCLVLPSNQNSFYGVYEGVDGNLYVAQRGLTPANANWSSSGLINKIDQASLQVLDNMEYCDFTSSGQAMIASGNNVYLMYRHGAKNVDVTFPGTDVTFNSTEFRWVQQALQMPDEAGTVTGIDLGELAPGQTLVLDLGGDTYQLNASVLPATAVNQALIYSSSNEDVVTIDDNGLITAGTHGTWNGSPARRVPAAESATITVTSASNPDVKQSVTVRVDNPTAVTDVRGDEGSVSVNGNAVAATGNKVVEVYNTLGQRVAIINGGQSVTLPAGIYVAAGRKLIVR